MDIPVIKYCIFPFDFKNNHWFISHLTTISSSINKQLPLRFVGVLIIDFFKKILAFSSVYVKKKLKKVVKWKLQLACTIFSEKEKRGNELLNQVLSSLWTPHFLFLQLPSLETSFTGLMQSTLTLSLFLGSEIISRQLR